MRKNNDSKNTNYDCYATLMSEIDERYDTGSKGLGKAVVGGLLFGAAGAIVGSISSGSKQGVRVIPKREGYGRFFISEKGVRFESDSRLISIPIEIISKIDTKYFGSGKGFGIRIFIDTKKINHVPNRKIFAILKAFDDSRCYFVADKSDSKAIRNTAKIIKKIYEIKKDNMIKEMKLKKMKRSDRKEALTRNALVTSWQNVTIF